MKPYQTFLLIVPALIMLMVGAVSYWAPHTARRDADLQERQQFLAALEKDPQSLTKDQTIQLLTTTLRMAEGELRISVGLSGTLRLLGAIVGAAGVIQIGLVLYVAAKSRTSVLPGGAAPS